MQNLARDIRCIIWTGIITNMFFVLPLVFAPQWLLGILNIPLEQSIWAQASGMLLFIISVFYVPAALDPIRYRINAWFHCLPSRAFGALFFTSNVLLFDAEWGFISIAIVDAIFGILVARLLLRISQQEQLLGLRRGSIFSPPSPSSSQELTDAKAGIQRLVWTGIGANLLFAIPLFFAPQAIIDFFKLELDQLIWAQSGGMLLFIISVFYVPAALNIDRYRINGWLHTLPSRAFGATFFTLYVILCGAEPGFLAIAIVDAVFGIAVLRKLCHLGLLERNSPDAETETSLMNSSPIRAYVAQPYLPVKDPQPALRRQQLDKSRLEYQFNYDHVPPLAYLDTVPKQELFSLFYWIKRLWSARPLPGNQIIALIRYLATRPLTALADYRKLFTLYKAPFSFDSYLTDKAFNEQRITGPNPQAIVRLDTIPDDFPFTDKHVQRKLGSEYSLSTELAHQRLYFVDFYQMSHIKGGIWRGMKKTIPAPRALFWWDADSETLECVGIQVKRNPDSRVFLPSDPPLDWLAAKIAYQCADANHQELGTHFTNCHAVMAPFAVVTNRQLGLCHPIHILLKPHFLFYLYDNELGRTTFVNPGGPVDRMMGGTLAESLGVSAKFYQEWKLLEATHPKDLERRKVEDPSVLSRYPFRDDGTLLWDAIVEFVTAYIALYYHQQSDIETDEELQAWAKELAAHDGGRIAGMPESIDSVEQLIEILSIVIWTCGPLHSMLNFSQWDFNFAPNMPYAIYADIPEEVGAVDQAKIVQIMPPFKEAAYQLLWNVVLTSYHHNPLGQYPGNYDDPLAKDLVDKFQQKLTVIEKEIHDREAKREHKFPYFKPSRAVNSINT